MTKKEIENFLLEKQGYLKKSPLEVAKKIWKHSPKHNLPKNESELQKELEVIKGVMAAMRVAKTVEKDTSEVTLMDLYHKILNEKNRPKKILVFDIETSPNIVLSWRIGREVNLSTDDIIQERSVICICWRWLGDSETQSLYWDNGDDKKMLTKFADILKQADATVTHNGDSFDIKWLRGRFLFHRISAPVKVNSIDTLKIARSQFKLNSNKLDYIGQYLGVGGKIHTQYGMWKEILLENNKQSLKLMVDYCKRDVELLEKVYVELQKQAPMKKIK